MAVTFQVEGLKEIIDKLERTEKGIKLIRPVFLGIGDDVIREAGRYPPETEANSPRPGGWYERGYGPRWQGGRGGSRTSEQLGKQWRREAGDREVTISNMASYAAFVHGEWQVGFHAARGWKKLSDTAQAMIPKMVQRIEEQIHRILGNGAA
jgi:hypothetical protein